MIITRLSGGLGNQLFQYAFGRAAALRQQTTLQLDMSIVYTPPRSYKLHHFAIQALPADPQVCAQLRGEYAPPTLGSRLMKKVAARLPVSWLSYVRERHYHFDPAMLTVRDGALVDGYWQTPKYFDAYRDLLRADLTLSTPLDDANQRMLDQIRGVTAVALHIRRGDYVADAQTAAYHGSCSLEYYHAAATRIAEHYAQPQFFIFSDDMPWVRAHLRLAHPMHVVDINDVDHDYADFALMSACRHFIIANSSFSWWAAWLSARPDKMVVAPLRWFNNSPHDTSDLLPAEWRRMA